MFPSLLLFCVYSVSLWNSFLLERFWCRTIEAIARDRRRNTSSSSSSSSSKGKRAIMLWRAAVRRVAGVAVGSLIFASSGRKVLGFSLFLTSRLLFFVSIVLLEFGYVRILSGEFFVQLSGVHCGIRRRSMRFVLIQLHSSSGLFCLL